MFPGTEWYIQAHYPPLLILWVGEIREMGFWSTWLLPGGDELDPPRSSWAFIFRSGCLPDGGTFWACAVVSGTGRCDRGPPFLLAGESGAPRESRFLWMLGLRAVLGLPPSSVLVSERKGVRCTRLVTRTKESTA